MTAGFADVCVVWNILQITWVNGKPFLPRPVDLIRVKYLVGSSSSRAHRILRDDTARDNGARALENSLTTTSGQTWL